MDRRFLSKCQTAVLSNFKKKKTTFCFLLLCSLHPHSLSLWFPVCNWFLSFVISVGPRLRQKRVTGWAQPSHPGDCSALISLCHTPGRTSSWQLSCHQKWHGSCLSFSRGRATFLTSGDVSLLLRWSSLWPHSWHQRKSRSWARNAAAAAGGLCGANPGTRAASCELGELSRSKDRGRPTCASPPLWGRQCAWAVCLCKVLSFSLSPWQLSLVLDICHRGTARKKSGFFCPVSLCFSGLFCDDQLNSASLGNVLFFTLKLHKFC